MFTTLKSLSSVRLRSLKKKRRTVAFKYRAEMKQKGTPVAEIAEEKESNKIDASFRTKVNGLVTQLEKAVNDSLIPK